MVINCHRNIIKIANPLFKKKSKSSLAKDSFSQSGEDLILAYLFKNHFGIETPSYLDIGANDPIVYSNTYLFYDRGGGGVLVEPDPELAKKIQQSRTRDKVLNIGISEVRSKADFYLVDPPTLNTFSKKEFSQYQLFYPGTTLRKIVKTKTLPIKNILDKYFPEGLDLLSIDVEGLDYQILSGIDFRRYRPSVICIETVKYENGDTWTKPKNIASFLYKNSYFLYSDTFINSIFVDKKRWAKNNQPRLKNFEGR